MAGDEMEPEQEPEDGAPEDGAPGDRAPEDGAPHRSGPRPRDDSEKAIGLEVARLFGMNPRLLVRPPAKRPAGEERTENS